MRQLLRVFVAIILPAHIFAGVIKIPPGAPAVPRAGMPDAYASAGLFVGVQEFPDDDELTPVKYAVDDAIDLAFEFAVERQPPLMRPDHVMLALSGEPAKPASQDHMKALIEAGATQYHARKTDILKLLDKQSRAAGSSGGILIVVFATHGMSENGTQYLLAQDSLLNFPETAVTDATIRETVSNNGVERALILFDACRERLTRGPRNGGADPRSEAAFISALTGVTGLAIFSAAAPHKYAYDDDDRHNGVFTAAVLDGLHCRAVSDSHGFITVQSLADFVEKQVLQWLQTHKDATATRATQLSSDGGSRAMPLAICVTRTALASQSRRP
jgi:hypothetical protein